MAVQLIIAGGGIGGLAAALAAARSGSNVRVFERAPVISEAGAGIQLGPNVTRILEAWSLADELRHHAAEPGALVVRDATDGRELARMELRGDFEKRYGAPYLTIHRADMQQMLLNAACRAGAALHVNADVAKVDAAEQVHVKLSNGEALAADALVVADGVWSTLRGNVVADGPTRATGHFAWRALAHQAALPQTVRTTDVTVWLAPRMHVVAYPVRRGEHLNVVALVESMRRNAAQGWESTGTTADLQPAMQNLCAELRQLLEAMPGWGVWSLHDRAPVKGPHELAKGRIALLGDAAHPMLPYLAQGAGMAIEDSQDLAAALADATSDTVAASLQRYAQARWRRCAAVQQGARRNARIFHASGVLRVARDAALSIAGEKLLDQPWLYAR